MFEGSCTCQKIRYRFNSKPLVTHACHCTWCQRETGSPFAMNMVIEANRVELLGAKPEAIVTPSASGKGQKIHRCPDCKVAVWSNYNGGGDEFNFIRVGTLNNPNDFPPDVHIYTSTKQAWVVLPPNAKSFEAFYNPQEVWSKEGLERWAKAKGLQG